MGSTTGWPQKLQRYPPAPCLPFPSCGLNTSASPQCGAGLGWRAAPAPQQCGVSSDRLLICRVKDPTPNSAPSPSRSFFLMSQPLICHIKPPHYQVSKFCSDNSDRGSCDLIAMARGSGELAGGYFMPCREPWGWAMELDNGLLLPII